MKPELLVNEHCRCGENPLYDDERDTLYWCDIPAGRIFALDLKLQTHQTIYEGREIGAFTLQSDGKLLLLFQSDAALLDPISGDVMPLRSDIVTETGRFNDCIADPQGRVFAGTVDWETQVKGALFRLDLGLNATPICAGTACSNGLAFTPDLRGLYWSDSSAKTVFLFDYDAQSGDLSNRRAWLETPEVTPDGLTIDREGHLWIAFFDGGCLRHYDATGNLIEQVEIPAKHVTSCLFGGADLKDLYITTAGGNTDSDSLDGALFRLRVEVGGRREFRSRIGI